MASHERVEPGEQRARYLIAAAWIAGIVGAITFLLSMNYDPGKPPTCGTEVMSRSDRCLLNGVDHGGYNEQQEAAAKVYRIQTGIRNVALVAAPVLAGAGVVTRIRSRRRSGAA